MEIDDVLIKIARLPTACTKKHQKKKKEGIEDEKFRKRNLISQEIKKVKRKKQGLQSFVDSLEKKVEKYCDKAEKDHCTESMMKGNSLRNTVKEKKN